MAEDQPVVKVEGEGVVEQSSMELILAALDTFNARLSDLEKAKPEPVAETEAPRAPEDFFPELPEGTVRFASPFTNYQITLVPAHPVITVSGQVIPGQQVMLQFTNHICDVTDPATIELARKNRAYGDDYWEDPTARPRTNVQVVDGARTTRPPKPMAPPPGRIAAPMS